ncbi:hypothetical protein FPV16_15385 [Methylobacterium sp. W2]|uniref:hypothetical protein n=1 Tax=Methylobacterium sp. W2 TaxID=2598107 RepID=UPI001D0C99C1|nr:hypothetical protein [Methylobacterium sp. W2]MCC0807595.1 hypothetical protein [Methylobacterium sp. W2]
MAKNLNFGNVVLCEHVIAGDRSKHTLINVFSGDVIVEELPNVLLFGFFAEFKPDTLQEIDILLNVFLEKEMIGQITGKVSPKKLEEVGTIVIPSFPVSVQKDTYLNVIASSDGYRDKEILKKKIFQQS